MKDYERRRGKLFGNNMSPPPDGARRLTPPISVRLCDDTKRRLLRVANRMGKSYSEVARAILEEKLATLAKELGI